MIAKRTPPDRTFVFIITLSYVMCILSYATFSPTLSISEQIEFLRGQAYNQR